ncbi:MAG: tetratricopeptide repeat protein [Candidatus Protochlamydia sp.]|nr:tetratricopeptide repeat protein [Candidatus Protochlamydia sp.]
MIRAIMTACLLYSYHPLIETLEEGAFGGDISSFSSKLSSGEHLQKGAACFQSSQMNAARLFLGQVKCEKQAPEAFCLAQMYLCRIALSEGNKAETLAHLDLMNGILKPDHPLMYQKHYLEGLFYFQQDDYVKAADCFERSLPPCSSAWKNVAFTYLIKCHLKQAAAPSTTKEEAENLLKKGEEVVKWMQAASKMEEHSVGESWVLAVLYELYLIKGKVLNNSNSFNQAEALLYGQGIFLTEEEKGIALLKKAAASPDYEEKQKIYLPLLESKGRLSADSWYCKGLNECEEAKRVSGTPVSDDLFLQAAESFKCACKLYTSVSPIRAAKALKHAALAYSFCDKIQAIRVLAQLIEGPLYRENGTECSAPALLGGQIALGLTCPDEQAEAIAYINGWIQAFPEIEDKLTKMKGILLTKEGSWKEAQELLSDFLKRYPISTERSEVLFWLAECAGHFNEEELRKTHLQQVYINDIYSPYAPLAYFNLFSSREYMRGSRKALKHLEGMANFFPGHPHLITAHYFLGLNHLKDRSNDNGDVIRRKDEIAAIDHFQQAESIYDELMAQKKFLPDEIPYFFFIRYKAMLDRALTNRAIAENASMAKKHIFLEYAETIFEELVERLQKQNLYPQILYEAEFELGCTYSKRGNVKKALQAFDSLIESSAAAPSSSALVYLLSRVWFEKGLLANSLNDYQTALECFLQAEQKNEMLSPDQRLEILIAQSECHKELQQYDKAMLVLSQVVNDEAISNLRVKAMYLRADIYSLQGRPELAMKQLEATARKGGEWSKKAKNRLEQDYGF